MAPRLMYHLWIAVISVWWMFSEQRGPRAPQTGTSIAGCSSKEMGLLLLEVHYTCFPLLSWVLNAIPPLSPFILPSSPLSSAICVYACPFACVSHRSPLRAWQPSWGDAWVPPVNFTAFICSDEWLAALSVPLPAISSGSLEPHIACSFGRSLQQQSLCLTQHTQKHSKQRRTVTFR